MLCQGWIWQRICKFTSSNKNDISTCIFISYFLLHIVYKYTVLSRNAKHINLICNLKLLFKVYLEKQNFACIYVKSECSRVYIKCTFVILRKFVLVGGVSANSLKLKGYTCKHDIPVVSANSFKVFWGVKGYISKKLSFRGYICKQLGVQMNQIRIWYDIYHIHIRSTITDYKYKYGLVRKTHVHFWEN